MDIILHLGAHRTATTSFQHYLRANAAGLGAAGIGVWGPETTRDGLLAGVIPPRGSRPAMAQLTRARGRVGLRLERMRAAGTARLLVSDENLIGAPRHCLRAARLYPGVGERLARLAHAFDGRIARAVFSIREQDAWWSSVLAYGVARGHGLPRAGDLDRLVTGGRGWRDVIADIACALPGADLVILPHERFASRPEARLAAMIGAETPRRAARAWLARSPDLAALRRAVALRGGDPSRLPGDEGRWQPFDPAQRAALRECYADDLFWLAAGADGLARLAEETGPDQAGTHPPSAQTTRGQDHDIEARYLA
ncbi:MAG: hypothetical protein CMN17_11665 [Roseovarius sp.]|nr:hypothetical protein [Roseovarius sp.]MBK46111.1 hypothetical protein [Roseovarius sp.]